MSRKDQETQFASSLFQQLGFGIATQEVPLVNSVKGGLILCMDDRNKLHRQLPGGAVPGAFTGLRIVMPGETPEERAQQVVERAEENGLIPTTHGDLARGALLGCAVRSALIDGNLEGFPTTTTAESQGFISRFNIQHRILRGEHTAKKIVVNFNEGTTIEPNGEYFVIDYWVPLVLGARMDKFASLVAQSSRLVLKRNNILHFAA